jgi:hypothetical protein
MRRLRGWWSWIQQTGRAPNVELVQWMGWAAQAGSANVMLPFYGAPSSPTTVCRCLIIFELLQQAVTFRRHEKHAREYDFGVHRVAWAFLRVAGPDGQPHLGEQAIPVA